MALDKKRNRDKKRIKKGQNKVNEQRLLRQIKYLVLALALVFAIASAVIIYVYDQDSYVAKVGGERITRSEYTIILNSEKQFMLGVFGISEQEAADFWNIKIEGENAIDIAKKRALDMAWESEIQYIKAKERGIKLTDEEKKMISNAIDSSIPSNAKTTAEINEYFTSLFGVTHKELKKVYKDYYLIEKFIDEVYNEINPTPEEIRKFYDENKDSIDMVTVRHILVKVAEDAAESEKEAARKKAEDILAKVNSGEDFASLVKEFSEDPGSIDTGGEYTFTRDGNYVQEFKDWSFRHEPGDTGIVETVHGFHVMELLEKKTEFEEVADIAEAQLKNKIFSDMLEEWKSMPEYRLVKNEKVYNSIS